MYLDDLRARLLELARRRVRGGLITERGLARMSGLSQPHIHNVLKDIRTLSLESADRLLLALHVSVADLMIRYPFEEQLAAHAVPLLRTRLGPGVAPQFSTYAGYFPVPAQYMKDLIDPVVAQVAPDPRLPAEIQVNDTILLDRNPAWRASPIRDSLYVISDGENAFVRYVRLGPSCVFLSDTFGQTDLQSPELIQLDGRDILELVRARIVWISREIGAPPPGPFDPPRERD